MKRKFGLMKKAYELSVLCDCEIALIIFNSSNKLFQYASTDMDKVLLKYTEYNEPHESRTNSDIVEALSKKEHRGCDSPDADAAYALTPNAEAKYKKINEEFDHMMRSHKMSTGVPQYNFMQVAPGNMAYSPAPAGGGGGASQAITADGRMLASQHAHLHRNMKSPDRPPSTGELQGSSDVSFHNGPGPAVNGCVDTPGGASSGLGKTLPPDKSPTPRNSDLRVVIPSSKGGMATLSEHRPSSQPLSTPVVSMATPSLTQHNFYSSINSAYNNDYQPSSSELSDFSSPAGASSSTMATWQEHMASLGPSSLSISANHSISIKAEPPSPPRDHLAQSGYSAQPHPLSASSSGRSPDHSPHEGASECVAPPRRLDFLSLASGLPQEGGESPTAKRMREDSWVT
ncbi:myocyte-specific enhancer factor 2A-like isoform X3 [Dunckerocampus dactyliophorus]|nr:myocyte-specific enhancer factor 2A-like isoform X3 [Dunckerocampus dactyliophorus]